MTQNSLSTIFSFRVSACRLAIVRPTVAEANISQLSLAKNLLCKKQQLTPKHKDLTARIQTEVTDYVLVP